MFGVCNAQQGCIYLIRNTVNIVLLGNILHLNFQHNYSSLLQSSVSHDPSEIILI